MGECLNNFGVPPCDPDHHIYDRETCYVGVPDGFGDFDDCADCSHGGPPCQDFPGIDLPFKAVLGQTGIRWLLPEPARNGFSRAADGMYHDLRAGIPLKILSKHSTRFVRGSCYGLSDEGTGSGSGIECHGFDTCFCTPHPDLVWSEDSPCGGGATVGQLVPGFHPDVFAYRAQASFGDPFCKKFWGSDADDQIVATRGTFLHGPAQIRSGGDWDCVVDPMVLCAGRIISSRNPCSYRQRVVREQSGATHYNQDESRSIFASMLIAGEPRIRMDDNPAPPDRAAATERNRVLEYAMTQPLPGGAGGETRFDQLDRLDRSGANIYGRSWNYLPGTQLAIGSLPVVAIYPNCYLRNSGERIRIELRLCAVSIDLGLDIVRGQYFDTFTQPGYWSPKYRRTHPHVRLRILAQCCWVAPDLPPGLVSNREWTIVRPWYPEDDPRRSTPVGLANPTDDGIYSGTIGINNGVQRWPHVEPVSTDNQLPFLDELVFVDEAGVEFEPFNDVQWLGYLGWFSDPSTPNLNEPWPFDPTPPAIQTCCEEYGGGTSGQCKQLACHFHDVAVPGWPYVEQPGDSDVPNNAVYDGSVLLSFRNSNYRAVGCGDG